MTLDIRVIDVEGVQGMAGWPIFSAIALPDPGLSLRNYLLPGDAVGTVHTNNRVMVKAAPDAPEVPMAGARVRLHRLADGYCAWQGISDVNGYYWPTGLEVGAEYYPVAIDLLRVHECDAAGPVVAVKAP